jgi:hypothetical protein
VGGKVMGKWYFTFMQKQEDLKDKYMVFEGTYGEAREEMCEVCGTAWGFQYSADNFLPQIEKYGLTEIKPEEFKGE